MSKRLLAVITKALAPIASSALKPGELCRLLNSTPAGPVIDDRRLREHRTRAGSRIGDGKTIDLFRYAAWLFHERSRKPAVSAETPPPVALSVGAVYDLKKERERERNAAASRTGRDIGELPPVADPKRRARAIDDPEYFYRTYFPLWFRKPWSDDHREAIAEIERTMLGGSCKAFAMPRGSGKTTLCEAAVIRAILTGKRRFVAMVGATKAAADASLESIKGELETNEILGADFPEVCFPIAAIEGINQRANGQLYKGERTRVKWSGDLLVLPTIPGSVASGAVICVRGITGRIRGMKYRRPDGEIARPDMAIVDDPQTDRSARSSDACKKRLDTIAGTIIGLAGPGLSVATFVPCTVIVKGDMADQILDRDKHPAFYGTRTALVYDWPTNEALWEAYAELRRSSMRAGHDGSKATAFYRKNRKAMDVGARVAWAERKKEEELSAIQHAMNLRIDHPETFDAEYQNDPRDPASDDAKLPSPAEIARKVSGLARGVVPLACTHLTAFIDVQQRALYWGVCGFSLNTTGQLLDLGTFPDQQRSYFVYRDIPRPLAREFPNAGVEGAIRGALDRLIATLATREFLREDGAPLRISRLLVDAGNWAELIYQACRESPHAGIVLPSKGMGIKADRAPISEWKRHPGQTIGEEWMLGRVENRRAVRLLTYDTNFWKSRLFAALNTAHGDPGSLTLFGKPGQDHQLLAAHLAAETRDKTEGRGRTVYVYKLKPEKPDNHWLDCLVGCLVGASQLGCRPAALLPKHPPAKRKPRSRVSSLDC